MHLTYLCADASLDTPLIAPLDDCFVCFVCPLRDREIEKVVAVLVVCGIALLCGRWPPSSSPTTSKPSRDLGAHREAEVDRVPVDAGTMPHKEAVLLVDGN